MRKSTEEKSCSFFLPRKTQDDSTPHWAFTAGVNQRASATNFKIPKHPAPQPAAEIQATEQESHGGGGTFRGQTRGRNGPNNRFPSFNSITGPVPECDVSAVFCSRISINSLQLQKNEQRLSLEVTVNMLSVSLTSTQMYPALKLSTVQLDLLPRVLMCTTKYTKTEKNVGKYCQNKISALEIPFSCGTAHVSF